MSPADLGSAMPPTYLFGLCLGILVAVGAIACRRTGPPFVGPFAYEAARPPATCGPLPLLQDTTGWTRLPVFGGQLTLRMPAGFVWDTTVRFMHGGRRWRRGPVWVEEVAGHWGYNSFRPFRSSRPPRRYSECETRIGRFTVFLAEREDRGRLSVNAWVRDTVRVAVLNGRSFTMQPDAVVAVEGPLRFATLVRTIMHSLR